MIKNVVCVGVFFCARRELHKGMKKCVLKPILSAIKFEKFIEKIVREESMF